MAVTPYRRANVSIPISDFSQEEGDKLIAGGEGQINNFPEGAEINFKWNPDVFSALIPAGSKITGYEINVRSKSDNGNGHKLQGLVGYAFSLGSTPIFVDDAEVETNLITNTSYSNTSIGGEGTFFGYSSIGATTWDDLSGLEIFAKLKVSETVSSDLVDFAGIPHTSEADLFDGSVQLRDTPTVGLRIYYEPPTPTKVILKPSGPFSVTKGASTAIADGASILNANQLTTSADGTSMATFDAPTHTQFNHFELTDFGFNIPSNAIINSIQFDIHVDREPFQNNQAFQLVYQFQDGFNIYKRHSIVYPANQNHIIDSNLYIKDSENEDFFVPDTLNNLTARIYWPVGTIDTFFEDSVTGELPSGTPVAQTTRDVYIGGIPGSNGNNSPSSAFYPKVTVNYNVPSKIKIEKLPDIFDIDVILPGENIKVKIDQVSPF